MSDYTLILGDCLDKMNQIEDGSIDAIIADLPYGTTACKWDVIIPFEPLWAHYKRVIKRNGAIVLFGSEPFSSFLRLSNLGWYKYDWVWDKVSGVGFQSIKSRPLKSHEDILIFGNGVIAYNPQMEKGEPYKRPQSSGGAYMGDKTAKKFSGWLTINDGKRYPKTILQFSNADQTNRLHPTQKPVALLAYLIRTYTNSGETVLDNVFGSYSTGEACLREGRRFIGIEKDETYYQIGVDRLARVAAELRGEFVPKPAKKPVEDLPMFAGAAL